MNHNFSETIILDALLQILEKKEFKKITIKEIADKCFISRSTFYRHYSSPLDVLAKSVELIFKNVHKEIENNSHSYKDTFIIISNSIKENSSLFRALYKQDQLKELLEFIEENLIINVKDGISNKNYVISFLTYGIFGIFKQRLRNDLKENPEELYQILINFLKK